MKLLHKCFNISLVRSICVCKYVASVLKSLYLDEEVIVDPARRELEVLLRAKLYFFHLLAMDFNTQMLSNYQEEAFL